MQHNQNIVYNINFKLFIFYDADFHQKFLNLLFIKAPNMAKEIDMEYHKEQKPMFVNREPSDITAEYKNWLTELKQRYRRAQVRAVVKVNGEMLNFYWELGQDIFAMSKTTKYGEG